ncbi:MAG: hypothetical protein WBV56_04020, partial [Azonexus sp.]
MEHQILSRLQSILLAILQAGSGRALPLLFLMLAALALANLESTPLDSLRNAEFDRYQRQMPRNRDAEPAIVIGIDSQSTLKY